MSQPEHRMTSLDEYRGRDRSGRTEIDCFEWSLTIFPSSSWYDKARQVVPSIAPLWGSPAFLPKPPILRRHEATIKHGVQGRVMLDAKNKLPNWPNRRLVNHMGELLGPKPTEVDRTTFYDSAASSVRCIAACRELGSLCNYILGCGSG